MMLTRLPAHSNYTGGHCAPDRKEGLRLWASAIFSEVPCTPNI